MDDILEFTTNQESHNRTIIHIDMDYYYAQVEEIRQPTLRKKPLGIQQKSIVVTSNYIAREFGIKKLMTINEAKQLCPQLVLVNGEDLTNYRQMSSKIFEILHKFTPFVEKLGLDENYLDVTDLVNQKLNENFVNNDNILNINGCIYPSDGTLDICNCGCSKRLTIGTQIAKDIRNELYKTLNITCCAGIAHNKLLAKLVGSMKKPNNQTVLVPAASIHFMRELDKLQKITGIGQKTEAILLENGINNVRDLQNCDFDLIKKKFGYESAFKLKELSFGRDQTPVRPSGKPKTIGLEDSCRPISFRTDVEERFRLLLMRLVNQVSEDGRIPVAVKVILRKFDAKKKTSHRETKQANILPSLFKIFHDGQIMLADGAHEKLLKIIMRLFERVVDMTKPFNITLLGLAFSKFQERKSGSSSIANFFIKKSDLEVQSVTSLKSDGLNGMDFPLELSNDYYRRCTTASPLPMLMDIESVSDVSDFSETEIEPSPKKTRLGLLIAKRRCLSSSDTSDIASPSKLRVAELRLNSRDSEKDVSMSPTTPTTPVAVPIAIHCITKTQNIKINLEQQTQQQQQQSNIVLKDDMNLPNGDLLSVHNTDVDDNDKNDFCNNSNDEITEIPKTTTHITGNLANIPCPSGVDPDVFKELPADVQNELISSWRNSITTKTNNNNNNNNSNHSGTTARTSSSTNTLHRYFIRNK